MNTIEIPDNIFKKYLINIFDKDGDGEISEEEALAIECIHCPLMGVKSFDGIEYFHNLRRLDCVFNGIEILDFRNNIKLKYLNCADNFGLKRLDISSCKSLEYLNCIQCHDIEDFNISNNTSLKKIYCGGMHKEMDIDLSLHKDLEAISLRYNDIHIIDLSSNIKLRELNVRHCSLGELDLSENILLEKLDCRENQFKTIDLSKNINFASLVCDIDFKFNPIGHWEYKTKRLNGKEYATWSKIPDTN